MFYSRCFLSLLVFQFNWQTNKTYYLQSPHKHGAWGGHAATANDSLVVQSSLQDLALGDEETIPALAQDPKPCKAGRAFRGSQPITRESCMSLRTSATLSESSCALSNAPLQVSVVKSVLPAPASVGGGCDCRLEQQVKAGGNALPSSSLRKGLITPCLGQCQRQGVSLSKETALLLGDVRSAVLRENRYKWRKVLTQGV